MTSQQSSYGEIQTLQRAVLAQCLDGILRAGGSKATRGRLEGRDAELIEAHQNNKWEGEHALSNALELLPEFCGLHFRWCYMGVPP